MDTLRRRTTFKFSEQDEGDDRILDEQEQDELIQNLRKQNEQSTNQQLIFVRILVLLSALLQFIHLLTPTKTNPLFVIFPNETQLSPPTIPFATGFTIISLLIHLNLAILFHPDDVRTHLQLTHNPRPLSYGLLYALSAVSPTLSIFLQLPWQITVWWLLTSIIVFVVQTVMDTVESGSQSVSELESMRYVARGA
ncbi:hypothetical protein P691DRAFT_665001 [Macrolepiota fuliginosa MF-IS2]|uniref:Uncharacterized protein n=1 Tax=Macrolepiota fuliginosa MF-IS2 TaxID=1400762 RepID=A0A9P5XHP6_9AGAR|nr:hypothetical protein P691DRAFT_665001 [Macrolepiota fuliginosa MF-IS2]